MAFIRLNLSLYFTDSRSLSIFPVEKASQPTVGSVVDAVTSLFALSANGEVNNNFSFFHEDFFIHPHLPSDVLLSLPGILTLQPIGDAASKRPEKNLPCRVTGKEAVEDVGELHLPHTSPADVRDEDLGVHLSESSSGVGSGFARFGRKRQKKINSSVDCSPAEPPSKRMKMYDRHHQCSEANSDHQDDVKGKSLSSENSYSLEAASLKMKDFSSAAVEISGPDRVLENYVLRKSSSGHDNKCCKIFSKLDSNEQDCEITDDSNYNSSVKQSMKYCEKGIEYNNAKTSTVSHSSFPNDVCFRSKSCHEPPETLCMPQSDEANSSGRDGDEPAELLTNSCSLSEKCSAAGHSRNEESVSEDGEVQESDEASTEAAGKPKSRRRRKHNKRIKKERRRLHQLVYGEDMSVLSEEQLSIAYQVAATLEAKHLGRGSVIISTDDRTKVRREYELELALLYDQSKFPSREEFSKWAENYGNSPQLGNGVPSRKFTSEERETTFASKHSKSICANDGGGDADSEVAVMKDHVKRAGCSPTSRLGLKQCSRVADISSTVNYTSCVTSTPICDTNNSSSVQNPLFDCSVSSFQHQKLEAKFDLSKFKYRVKECAKRYHSAEVFQEDFSLLNDMSNGDVSTFVHERKEDRKDKSSTTLPKSRIEDSNHGTYPLDADKQASVLPFDARSKYPFRMPPAPTRFPTASEETRSDFFFLSCMEEAREPLVYNRSDRVRPGIDAARLQSGCDNTLLPELSGDGTLMTRLDDAQADAFNAGAKALGAHEASDDNKPSLSDSQVEDAQKSVRVSLPLCDNKALVSKNNVQEFDSRCNPEQDLPVHYYGKGQKCAAHSSEEPVEMHGDPNASFMSDSHRAFVSPTPGITEVNSFASKDCDEEAHSQHSAYDHVTQGKNFVAEHKETINFVNGGLQSSEARVLNPDDENVKVNKSATSLMNQSQLCNDPISAPSPHFVTSVNSECSEEKSCTKLNGFSAHDGCHSTPNNWATRNLANDAHDKCPPLQMENLQLCTNLKEGSTSSCPEIDVDLYCSKEQVVKDRFQPAGDSSKKAIYGNRVKKYRPRVHSAVGSLLQMLRSKDRSHVAGAGRKVSDTRIERKSDVCSTEFSYSEVAADVQRVSIDIGYSEQSATKMNGTFGHKSDGSQRKRVRTRNRKNRFSMHELDHPPSVRLSLWDIAPDQLKSEVDTDLQLSSLNAGSSVTACADLSQKPCWAGLEVNSLPSLTSVPRVGDVILFYESNGSTKAHESFANEECGSSVNDSGPSQDVQTHAAISGANCDVKSSSEELFERPGSSPIVGRVLTVTNDSDVTLSTVDIPAGSGGRPSLSGGEPALARGDNRVRCVRWSTMVQPRLVFP